MASNLQLTELEQQVLDYVQRYPGTSLVQIWAHLHNIRGASAPITEVNQAIVQLVSLNLISADENLRYSAVGKEL